MLTHAHRFYLAAAATFAMFAVRDIKLPIEAELVRVCAEQDAGVAA